MAPNFRPEAAAPGSRVNLGTENGGRKTPPNVQKIQGTGNHLVLAKHFLIVFNWVNFKQLEFQQNFRLLFEQYVRHKMLLMVT